MIKALSRLKESRPVLTFVKTGVSAASVPKFLVEDDIIAEEKRTYTPSPLRTVWIKEDPKDSAVPVPVPALRVPVPQRAKKVLKKSARLQVSKAHPQEKQVLKKQDSRVEKTSLYKGKRPGARVKKRPSSKGIWWRVEELIIMMNKMSLFRLFLVLLLLGGVFFGIGFLAAVSTVQEKAPPPSPTWQQANQLQSPEFVPQGKAGRAGGGLKTVRGVGSTFINQKVSMLEGKIGSGPMTKLVQKVPRALQPFAMQMQNKVSQKNREIIGGGGQALKGVFHPSPYGSTPPPPPSPYRSGFVPGVGGGASRSGQPTQPVGWRRSQDRYTPSQQAFRQAGQSVQQQQGAPHPIPQGGQGGGTPGAISQNPGQPYPYAQVPQGQPIAPAPYPGTGYQAAPGYAGYGGQPPSPPSAGQPYSGSAGQYLPASPPQSQPYGVSQPYGDRRGDRGNGAPFQQAPKMVGMG
jgi:hypothetical protein